MSDKALEFEDFILDDYDFNVYTDWDLMDLWEWVEMDDFSDLEGNISQAEQKRYQQPPAPAPKPQSHAPPDAQQPQSHNAGSGSHNQVDQIMSEIDQDGTNNNIQPDVNKLLEDLEMDALPQQTAAASAQTPPAAPPTASTEPDYNDDDDFDFDFDFSSDEEQAPVTNNDDNDDFDFDFDFSDDDTTALPHNNIESNASEGAGMSQTLSSPLPSPISDAENPLPITNSDDEDDDFDFDFDFSDDDDLLSASPSNASDTVTHHASAGMAGGASGAEGRNGDGTGTHNTSPPQAAASDNLSPPAQPPQMSSDNNDDFDFDFDFSDDGQEFQDLEISDSFDLDMTSETDALSDNDLDFNFDLQSDDNGFGTGGYTPEPAQEEPEPEPDDSEPRYIETSAGTLDIETDNILGFLQQLEFDEFLETLQLHPHVYDRIMASDEWSKEEIEFLRSIEPLVKDAEKVAQIRAQKAKEEEAEKEAAKHRMPATTGYEGKPESEYSGETYGSQAEMQNALNDRAIDAALHAPPEVRLMPAKLCAEWSKDTHTKRSSRVGKQFSKRLKKAPKTTQKPWLKHVPKLPTIQTGKHERYYDELNTIINNELYAMCQQLDTDSMDFIKADGQRFGDQFTEFLLGKYGTKILFLYRSQMENDLLADKMFEDFHNLFSARIEPPEPEDYTQNFFRAVLTQMKTHNIKI